MCRKNPKDCRAKIKCNICENAVDSTIYVQGTSKLKFFIDNQEICDNISLNEVDALLEQQTYIIDIKGDN